MGTLKHLLRVAIFVSLVLAIGQIQVGVGTVGGEFVSAVDEGSRWAGRQIIRSKWLAGFKIPDFLIKWMNTTKIQKTQRRAEFDGEGREGISSADKDAVLRLLRGQN